MPASGEDAKIFSQKGLYSPVINKHKKFCVIPNQLYLLKGQARFSPEFKKQAFIWSLLQPVCHEYSR